MIEKRVYRIEDKDLSTRASVNEQGQKEIVGYAALINTESKPITERINGKIETFQESIDPLAFRNTVIEDCIYCIDHDPSKLIARQSANNLTVQVTEKGLLFRAIPPNTSLANDLIENINVGNYQENSFAFRVKSDKWTRVDGTLKRHITAIDRIVDVSTVINGAYATIIATRNLDNVVIEEGETEVRTEPKQLDKDVIDIDFEFIKLRNRVF